MIHKKHGMFSGKNNSLDVINENVISIFPSKEINHPIC